MKKLFVLVLATFAFQTAQAEQPTYASSTYSTEHNWNMNINPLGLLIGGLSLGVDYRINDSWTVGPFASYVNMSIPKSGNRTKDTKFSGSSVGVRGVWYKNGTFKDGIYLSPAVLNSNMSLETADATSELSASGEGTALRGIVGYGWFWQNFNQTLGAGFTTGLGDSKLTIKSTNGDKLEEQNLYSSAALEYNLGWVF